MDAFPRRQHHAPVRVLPHIKKIDDALGDFLVRVSCSCGASRHIEPEALARLVGRKVTLAALATRMRCSNARTAGRRSPRWSRWRGRGRGGAEESGLKTRPIGRRRRDNPKDVRGMASMADSGVGCDY
jgi:hypothetical protein